MRSRTGAVAFSIDVCSSVKMVKTSMGCMLKPAKGSMSVLRWCTAWMCLYRARMWMNLGRCHVRHDMDDDTSIFL